MGRWATSLGNIALVGAGFAMSLVVLCFVELVVRLFFMPPEHEIQGESLPGFNLHDPDYGYKPKQNSEVTAVRKGRNGEIIYSARYSTDEYSRRVIPLTDESERSKFLIFFGCSFTFGAGLNDDQTMPYFVGQRARCYEPYNYAYSGYGPQHMLVRLQDSGFSGEIKQKNGIMIYSPAHVSRAIGSYKVSTAWGRNFPYFYLDRHGDLRREGDFQSGRPVRSQIYELLSKIKFIDIFLRRYDIPHNFSENDLDTTAKIIERSFELFNRAFPDSSVYFMLLPGVDDSDQEVARRLKDLGIQILDFSDRKEFSNEGYVIPKDGHPTALWNKELADLIVDKLGIQGDKCRGE